MDDAQLVARARGGSRDAAQETFARAFGALDSFDADRPLEPWLRRIAVNRTIDELRRERWLELVDREPPDREYEAGLPDDATIEAVRALDPDRRAVVVLRFWLDWSLEQISDALDVPVGTVSSRLTRALAELRNEGGESDACSA